MTTFNKVLTVLAHALLAGLIMSVAHYSIKAAFEFNRTHHIGRK